MLYAACRDAVRASQRTRSRVGGIQSARPASVTAAVSPARGRGQASNGSHRTVRTAAESPTIAATTRSPRALAGAPGEARAAA